MSQETSNSTLSRLAQVQLKFQQKQLQDKERRKIELTSTIKHQANGETPPPTATKTIGNGRVRQMFDDRRRGAGIDRSHPLKPIAVTSASKKPPAEEGREFSLSGGVRAAGGGLVSPGARPLKRTSVASKSFAVDKTNPLNLAKNFTKLSLRDSKSYCSDDRAKAETSLKPLLVKKTPATTITQKSPILNANRNTIKSPTTSAKRTVPSSTVPSTKSSATKITMSVKPPPRTVTPPPGMASCKFCSRNFLKERLEKHQQICQKMNTKKRKIFDATKQRVGGTEAEVYVKRQIKSISAITTNAKPITGKKTDWRRKHEEFIAAIRSAKKVQAHLAKGGKLQDLPPPPPSENADYIQCPHCLRRFNQAAAERHIPKCVNMKHNKPRPGQALKKR